MSSPVATRHYDDLTVEQRELIAARLVARSIKQHSGCWEVQGQPVHSGHMQISIGTPAPVGRGLRAPRRRKYYARVRAHVFAWEMAHKRRVPAGLVVMHSCDNPRCVNPAHLSIGTQAENVRDSIRKGRYNVFGVQRLNATQVREIRQRMARGELQKDIARHFGVARNTISGIATRASWDHLDPLDTMLKRIATAIREEGR